MSELLNVSVNICTYNREYEIEECLQYVKDAGPKEIIVIDGNSTDNTRAIVESIPGVTLIKSERKGLGIQRQIGVENSSQPYIMIVDSDDRLDKDCISILLEELIRNDYDGIEARHLPFHSSTYWQKATDYSLIKFSTKPGCKVMLGRPALYKKNVFEVIQFDPLFPCNEDTDFSRQMEIYGFIQAQGTGITRRIHDATAGANFKKWLNYGRGDAFFALKYPERKASIIKNSLYNYMIKKSFITLFCSKPHFALFFFLKGLVRIIGYTISHGKYKKLYSSHYKKNDFLDHPN